MKTNFLFLVLLILGACQNIEDGKKNTFIKKENNINMNSTISEIEIKN